MIEQSHDADNNTLEPQKRYQSTLNKILLFEKSKKNQQTIIRQFFQYVVQCLKLYIEFLQNWQTDVTENLKNHNFESLDCHEITNYFIYIKKFCRRNIEKYQEQLTLIQKINYKDLISKAQKLRSKYQFYFQAKPLYVSYNKKLFQLNKNCLLFKEMLQQAKQYEKPLKYYDQKEVTKNLENIEKVYNECFLRQRQIQHEEKLIIENQEYLRRTLDEVFNQFTHFINQTLEKISQVCGVLIQKRNIVLVPGFQRIESQEYFDDQINPQARRINKELNFKNQSFIQNFGGLLYPIRLKPHTKQSQFLKIQLLEDRCNIIKDKFIKEASRQIQQKKLFMQILKKHSLIFKDLNRKVKIAKTEIILQYYQNNIQNYKRQFEEQFGTKIMTIQSLVFILLEEFNEATQKLQAFLNMQSNDYFRIAIEIEERQLSKSKKKISTILKNNQNIKKKINTQATITFDKKQQQQCSQTVLQELRELFDVIELNRVERVKNYNEAIQKLISYLHKIHTNFQQQILSKQQLKYEVFLNINIENETIAILQENSVYDILLTELRKTQSEIKHGISLPNNLYKNIKKILNQKNLRVLNKFTRPLNLSNSTLCCAPTKFRNNKQFDQFECSVLKNGNWRAGKLYLSKIIFYFEGIKHILRQQVTLKIPVKEIIRTEIIQQASTREKALDVETIMGKITIKSKQAVNIQQKLKKQNPQIVRIEDQSIGKSLIKNLLSSFDLDSSKLHHKGKKMKVYQVDLPKNLQKSTHDDLQPAPSVAEAIQLIIKRFDEFPNFFGIDYNITDRSKKKNIYRTNYLYVGESTKMQVKEQLIIQLKTHQEKLESQNQIRIKYNWKIKPVTTEFSSFMHSQQVSISFINQQAALYIEENPHDHWQRFTAKIFYKAVAKMNDALIEQIYKITHRKVKMEYFLNNHQLSQKFDQQSADGIFNQVVISKNLSNLRNSIPHQQVGNLFFEQ